MHKLGFDIKILKKYCSKKGWTYRELAKEAGLSLTQTYHLLHGSSRGKISGGPATFGCLMALQIPGLFFLEHELHLQTIREPIDILYNSKSTVL